MSKLRRPNPFVSRCHRCGEPLAHFDGERYCPSCLSYAPAPEPPPEAPPAGPPPCHVAATASGTFVDANRDLAELLRVVREDVMGTFPADEDVIVTANNRVVALVLGATGTVVLLPEGGAR
jgi:hypothetical protein